MPQAFDDLSPAEQRRRQRTWRRRAYISLLDFWGAAQIRFWSIWTSIWHFTLGRWIYIKCANHDAHLEVATIRFVAAHTTIPVPKVLCTFKWGLDWYIAMSRAPGIDLKRRKWRKLSPAEQDSIVSQLATFFTQLRSIPPPPGTLISSVLGGPFMDYRVYSDDPSGPYRDEQHFNLQLRCGRPIDDHPEVVRSVHTTAHPLVFTHNDVAPRNIMVDGARITALIDWECAAWLPDYWEYCKTVNWNYGDDQKFKDRAPEFLTPFKREAEADIILMKTYRDIHSVIP